MLAPSLARRAPVTLEPNPEEVAATRYVTQDELRGMMQPSSGLLWSPWFRIIADRWLQGWWGDLEGVLGERLAQHQDLATVHKVL